MTPAALAELERIAQEMENDPAHQFISPWSAKVTNWAREIKRVVWSEEQGDMN